MNLAGLLGLLGLLAALGACGWALDLAPASSAAGGPPARGACYCARLVVLRWGG